MLFFQPSSRPQVNIPTSKPADLDRTQNQHLSQGTGHFASTPSTSISSSYQPFGSARPASSQQVSTAADMAAMASSSAATHSGYFGQGVMSANEPGMPPSGISWGVPSGQPASSGHQVNMTYQFPAPTSGHVPNGPHNQSNFSQFVPRRTGTESQAELHVHEGHVGNGGMHQGSWNSPSRSNLKRAGDDSWEEQGPLRRPASFPALPQQAGQVGYEEEGKYSQPGHDAQNSSHQHQQTSPARGQVPYKVPTPTSGKSSLQDALGIHRQEQRAGFEYPSHMIYMSNTSPAQRGVQIGGPMSRGEVTPAFSTISTLPSTSPASSTHHRRESGMNYGLPAEDGPHSEYQYQQKSSPAMYQDNHVTPQLMRATQVYAPPQFSSQGGSTGSGHSHTISLSSSSSSPPDGVSSLGSIPHFSQRAHLELHGNVHDMALGWSHDEWRSRRRLVQFWRKQEGTKIQAICKPILPEQYVPNSVVVSCIFWDVTNECYITSVDIIYLLEALVASRFNVEEKNRIRRNLEGLKPKTISKQPKNADENLNRIHDEFFKLVMSFPNPKPRHIEKDIKIFPWRTLPAALNKIISKYSAAPLMAAAADQPPSFTTAPHIGSANSTPVTGDVSSFSTPTPGSMHYWQQVPQGHHYGQQQQQPPPQQQQQHGEHSPSNVNMRRLNPNLSIDVSASNSAGSGIPAPAPAPNAPGSASGGFMNSLPGLGPLSSRGIASPASNFLLPQPSPRRTPGMWGMSLGGSGSSTFNINDFVVSPSAFAQTPLQQQMHVASGGGGHSGAGAGGAQTQGPDASGSTSSARAPSAPREEGGLGVHLGPFKQD